ncbi:hypothetical protein V1264_010797 [Littorina saxatilis]|uniref:Uncharacterized protein n=1 Tax=Littorina saxatilis TaxID=31220 RepID=A0AAN9BTK5_9CAEN
MSQLLNQKRHELDMLANFMGHSITVHREYYRLPEGTTQLAKLSKLLLQMEAGDVATLRGKSLDDITMDESEELGCNDEEDQDEGHNTTKRNADETEDDQVKRKKTEEPTASSVKKEKKGRERKKWSSEEIKAVSQNLAKFINTETLPGKSDCLLAQKKSLILMKREWTQIKFCVKNMIAAEKRKLRKLNQSLV